MRACSILLLAAITQSCVAAKPAEKAVPKLEQLPEATVGTEYKKSLDPGTVPWKKPSCVLAGNYPSWLQLDCANSIFNFEGHNPLPVTTATQYDFIVVVIDGTTGVPYRYSTMLIERPAVEHIVMGKKAAKAGANAAPSAPDDTKLEIMETTPIAEGVTRAEGEVLGIPSKQSLHVQIWTRPEGEVGSPASQMTLVSTAGASATVQQVDLKGNKYTVEFSAPLAAGQLITIVVVTDDGRQVKSVDRLLTSVIDVKAMMLKVDEPVVVDAPTITGRLSSMPRPAVDPIAAKGSAAATYGNYPGIVVWWRDAASGKWSQAAPANASTSSPFLSVNADGRFQVTLPSKLKIGQKIRVDVVPPPGRAFTAGTTALPAFLPPPATVVSSLSKELSVYNDTALSQPTIATSPFYEGTTVLSGTATIPSSGVPAGIVVMRLNNQAKVITDEDVPKSTFDGCLQVNGLSSKDIAKYGVLLPLTTSSSNTFVGTVDATAGTYKVTLAEALKQGDWIQVIQVLPAGSELPTLQSRNCTSRPVQVTYPYEFYRTNLSFVAGVLISNSSSGSSTSANFSQANQFYAFNADHAWRLPGYNCVGYKKWGDHNKGDCSQTDGWHSSPILPGFNSFFEGRLTAIPVSTATNLTNATAPATTSGSSTASGSTLLSSQKVFRVEMGVFLPWVLIHGSGPHPQGLFIGPIGKAGFDTVAGAGTATSVILPSGGTGTLNFQTAYKFYAYGARLGNVYLSQSPNRAPLIEHYLDVTFGRYSNLQSYICHGANNNPLTVAQSGTSCLADYPQYFHSITDIADSRKQLYRIDLEGLVRIPVPLTAVPFYIGFNANIAQHTWQAEALDHGYAPPDDIRILFGTKIDIGSVLASLKLGAN